MNILVHQLLQKMILKALNKKYQKKSLKDYTIVTLLSYSGVRISEILNIKFEDIDLTAREILIRYGKGKKQRYNER